MTKTAIFKNPRWRTAAILKIVKSPYLSEKSSDFDEIWYTTSDIEHGCSQWPNIEIFKIQDGGGRHLENRFFGHKSSTNCPISAKFCMRKQNGRSTRATWQKLHIFKFQHGGRPPFWKSLNCHTASDIEPDYSHVTKNYNFWNSRWRLPPSWKSLFLAITH